MRSEDNERERTMNKTKEIKAGERKKGRKKKGSGTKPREVEDDQSTAHADSIEPETRVV